MKIDLFFVSYPRHLFESGKETADEGVSARENLLSF